jgi:hypothetical protein
LVAKQACLQSVTPGPLIVFPYAGSRQGWIEGIGRPGLTLGDSIGPHHIADVESRGVISHGEIADSFNDALEQPDLILTDPDREQDAATPEICRKMPGAWTESLTARCRRIPGPSRK